MVSQRDGVIAELRDEGCTLWAFGWLAFRCRAAKAFPGLDFKFQVPNEEVAEESVSEDEAGPGVLSDTPSFIPLPGEAEVSDLHDLEAHTSEAACSSSSHI